MTTRFRTATCDVMRADCPARHLLALLGDKWSLLVIHALGEEPRRTGALRRRIGGVSEKMLLQTLGRLRHAGLVSRRSYAEVPPRVEYALTELGWSLSPLVRALDLWIEEHAPDVFPEGMALPPDRAEFDSEDR